MQTRTRQTRVAFYLLFSMRAPHLRVVYWLVKLTDVAQSTGKVCPIYDVLLLKCRGNRYNHANGC